MEVIAGETGNIIRRTAELYFDSTVKVVKQ